MLFEELIIKSDILLILIHLIINYNSYFFSAIYFYLEVKIHFANSFAHLLSNLYNKIDIKSNDIKTKMENFRSHLIQLIIFN